jgi:hypothetical protein
VGRTLLSANRARTPSNCKSKALPTQRPRWRYSSAARYQAQTDSSMSDRALDFK